VCFISLLTFLFIDAPTTELYTLSLHDALPIFHFPSPRRIVLAGSSGGGYGTILASFLVRYVYPGVPIDVVNDAGAGIAKEGDPRSEEHTSELQSRENLVCRLLLEKKNIINIGR